MFSILKLCFVCSTDQESTLHLPSLGVRRCLC